MINIDTSGHINHATVPTDGLEPMPALYKIAVSDQHIASKSYVTKSDITSLGIPAQDTTYSAGSNITISTANVISATDTKYTGDSYITVNNLNKTINHAIPEPPLGTTCFFLKFRKDAAGHVYAVEDVVKSDITRLGIPAQDTTYTAGNGISIVNNVISATGGGGGGDYTPDNKTIICDEDNVISTCVGG